MHARLVLTGIFLTAIAAMMLHAAAQQAPKQLLTPEENKHLRNVRQVTFGGQNAEAYFSADDKWLSFQHAGEGVPCDQEYVMPVDPAKAYTVYPPNPNEAEGLAPQARRVSNGAGRTTGGDVFPDDQRVLFASTHGAATDCPKPPDYSQGYVWAIYPSYKIYTAKMDGSGLKLLENAKGYN